QRPRPYVVRPPVGGPRAFGPGERFQFTFGLLGSAAQLFPYVVMAAQLLDQSGLGRRVAQNDYRRGTVRVAEIAAVHPLSGATEPLYQAGRAVVQAPGLPVRPEEVRERAAALPTNRLTLHFRTPLRLTDDKRLVRQIALRPLIQRLMRRLDDLSRAYGDGPLQVDFQALLEAASRSRVTRDTTRWIDLASYSSRQRMHTPIGGLVGSVTFEGDLGPLRELLLWGSLIHVGKNAVKGDGWYEIEG
ncbi:MAG TPA: CRISPR system precrRNA processing endoribonuclease RAMP protein Cas6, partial [Herpetosiphonaceae bacterium]|nr:CRISPR system precrRNA processing endoribonuclease RAMP protein Cas6 [Herpetosiphonaceae bacterium]